MNAEAAQRFSSAGNAAYDVPHYEFADVEKEIDGSSSRNDSVLSDPGEIIEKQMKKMNDWVRVANFVLSLCAVTYIVFFVYLTTAACLENNLDYLQPINEVTSYMFLFLGLIFFTVGVIMNISLSHHLPDFYKNYKCLLWTATILLTCPLFIRAAKDYAYYHSDGFYLFYDSHWVLDNTLYCILSTVLPVVTQTSSLVFGVMR